MPEYISEKEVSRITGRALPTLRQDRHLGRGLPYHKLGRQVRYRIDDIEQFMNDCRIEPTESLSR